MPTVGRADVKIVADARGFARDVQRAVDRELRDVNATRGLRNFTRTTTRTMANAGSEGAAAFGGSASRGMAGAFSGAIAALLLIVVAALPAIGALMGGLLVLAFGGAIAGIGIFAAAQAEEVKEAFSDMADEVGNTFKDLAKPLRPALVEIAGLIARTVSNIAPAFGAAFAALAPALVTFTDQLGRGFEALAESIEPLTDAFITLLEDLGPELADNVFPRLAEALIGLSAAVSENSDTVAAIIGWFLSLVGGVIDVIAWLTNLAGWFADNPAVMAAAIGAISAAFLILAGAALLAVAALLPVSLPFLLIGIAIGALIGVIIHFRDDIVRIFGQIAQFFSDVWDNITKVVSKGVLAIGKAINNMVQAATTFFSNFARNVRDRVSQIVSFFGNLRQGIADRLRAIGGFFSDLAGTVRDRFLGIIEFIKSVPGKIVSAARGMWDGISGAFKSMINGIIRAWNNLGFRTGSINTPFGSIGPFELSTPNIPLLANGGIIQQAGAVVVGEAGPELLTLQRGAVVSPLRGGEVTGGMPDEFEAVAVVDLGEGITERLNLTFRRMRRGAMSGSGRQVGRVAAI